MRVGSLVAVASAAWLLQVSPVCAETFAETRRELSYGDVAARDYFGGSVAIDGDTLVVGAQNADESSTTVDTGAAFVFSRRDDGGWELVDELRAADAEAGALMGVSVDVRGDLIAAGASGARNSAGAVHLFGRTQRGDWVAIESLSGSDDVDRAVLSEVALGQGVLVSGAPGEGAAYIHERRGAAWVQVARFERPGGGASDLFGDAVSVESSLVVVGAPRESAARGAVYLYERVGEGAWDALKRMEGDDPDDRFGTSVAVSENVVAVGAPGADDGRGAVFLFERNTGGVDAWGAVARITPENAVDDERFGSSLSISRDTLVVGANAGAVVRVYERHLGGVERWGLLERIELEQAGEGSRFGAAVDVDGGVISIADPVREPGGRAWVFERADVEPCERGGCGDGLVCDESEVTAKCEAVGGCGNNILEGSEGCDDGNVTNGDGCNASCAVEDPGLIEEEEPGDELMPGGDVGLVELDRVEVVGCGMARGGRDGGLGLLALWGACLITLRRRSRRDRGERV